MSEIVLNNILSLGFLFLWIITLIGYQMIKNRWDGGSLVIVLYIIYAVFAIMTLNDPLFSIAFNQLKLFPYIYLYSMMIIALSPIIIHHCSDTSEIENPHTKILYILTFIIIISSIMLIPSLISGTGSGLISIFTDSSAGKEAYLEQVEGVEDSGSTIRNLPAIIFNSLTDVTVFLFFYFLTLEKKNIWILSGLIFSFIINFLICISQGQRGGLVTSLLTLAGGYLLFKQYMSKKVKKISRHIGLFLSLLISFPIIVITVSRFDGETGGIGGFVNWYIGQGSLYFNNYGLTPGGCRNGDRTINLFKRFIDSSTSQNFVERRDKYHNMEINDNLFSTFVGDFTLDFGPAGAFFIFVIFYSSLIRLTRERKQQIKLYKLLLLYFALCISLQGGMTLFSYSDVSGNLRMLNCLLLYAYLRYHEQFSRAFPLQKNN